MRKGFLTSQGLLIGWDICTLLPTYMRKLKRSGSTPVGWNPIRYTTKDVMQSESINELISDRVRIKEQIYRTLKDQPLNVGGLTLEQKYGIELISFVLRDTRYGEKLAEASEEKKRRELIAEAENYAADLEASRTRKLYAAYSDSIKQMRKSLSLDHTNDPYLFDFLNQQKWAAAYQKNQQGQNTFVLNNTASSVPVTLPSPDSQLLRSVQKNATNEKDQNANLRQLVRTTNQAD